MFSLFRSRTPPNRVPELYGAIVAQARHPALFADWGVPDTVFGRFEMVALHVFLVLRRLKAGAASDAALAQRLFDHFFGDVDRSLREIGVGDLSVGKKVKGFAKGFYGRIVAYDHALDAGDRPALEAALARNVGDPDDERPVEAARLAGYVIRQDAALAAHPVARIAAGDPGFLPVAETDMAEPDAGGRRAVSS